MCTERVEDDSSNLFLALASEAYEGSVVGSLHQNFVSVSQVRVMMITSILLGSALKIWKSIKTWMKVSFV